MYQIQTRLPIFTFAVGKIAKISILCKKNYTYGSEATYTFDMKHQKQGQKLLLDENFKIQI